MIRSPILTSLAAGVLLSGCAVASGMTEQELDIREQAAVDQYMPASREMRDNIETQELFAQAAFWSHEYDLNPSDLEAAIKLAASVRKLGNPSRAVEITQTTRAIHPRDPYLLAEHAAGLIADERALDAIPVLDQGLRLAPQYARLWSLKGAALDQTEDYPAARQHYARALQITPNDPSILANMGLSHALAGDPATAEGWLRRAASVPGAGAGVRQNLALVLQLQGKTEESRKQARMAKLSRGDRKLPPPPVPAFQPRTANGAPVPQQGPQASVARAPRSQAAYTAPRPQSRLTTSGQGGQQFRSASDAARAAAAASQSGAAPQTAPVYRGGEMNTEQKDVLAQIARSVQPQSTVPQPPNQQESAPHVVGPALRQPAPQTYQPQAGYPALAGQPQQGARRGAARRRR